MTIRDAIRTSCIFHKAGSSIRTNRVARHWWLAACLGLAALAGCQTGPVGAGGCRLQLLGSLPLHAFNGHVGFQAQINDQPVKLMFDTGAFTSVIRRETAARLHLRVDGVRAGGMIGVGGEQSFVVYNANSVSLGNLHGRNFPFAVMDVSHFLPPSVDGIVGMDMFRNTDMDVDMLGGRLILYAPASDCSRPSAYMKGPLTTVKLVDAKPGRPFELTSMMSQPRIRVAVEGTALNAVLDTGSPISLLFAGGAAKLGLAASHIPATRMVQAGGIGPRRFAAAIRTLDAVDLGELQVRNLPVAIINEASPKGADMLLGLDFYVRIHVWISHSSGMLILQYPPSASPLDEAVVDSPH